MSRFPKGFRWAVATAAHQIEGGNWNNDWWQWEHAPGTACREPSGDAADSWHRWNEDVAIVAELGFDSYRFSVEWSRIEPEEGEFSRAALDHYRRICGALLERGLDPVVTFHHFTNPRWIAERGGWESTETVDRFARFCDVTAKALGTFMTRACTVNEPNVVATMGWAMGMFPPGKVDPDGYGHAVANLVAAHRRCVEAIRQAAPGVPVGLALSMTDFQEAEGGEAKRDELLRTEDVFLEATEADDFLGVQVYTRMLIGPDGWLGPQPGVPALVMGYEFWPGALEACLRRAWTFTGGRLPLLVTENGIGTDDDNQRIDYVHAALQGVLHALADGIDVIGYTYWSLLDNFEWAFGYRPRFGIVEVDRQTFERRPKPSAHWLGGIARSNMLNEKPA